jgi:hypothetical protein
LAFAEEWIDASGEGCDAGGERSLRLTFAGISKREVARRTGLASSTVRATIARFQSLRLI